MLDLFIKDIPDLFLRKNFERIKSAFNSDPIISGQFKHFEIIFTSAVTHFKFPHNLGFKPSDIIQTSLIGTGSLTFNYSLFDATNLDITTTGAVTARLFAGRYTNA